MMTPRMILAPMINPRGASSLDTGAVGGIVKLIRTLTPSSTTITSMPIARISQSHPLLSLACGGIIFPPLLVWLCRSGCTIFKKGRAPGRRACSPAQAGVTVGPLSWPQFFPSVDHDLLRQTIKRLPFMQGQEDQSTSYHYKSLYPRPPFLPLFKG